MAEGACLCLILMELALDSPPPPPYLSPPLSAEDADGTEVHDMKHMFSAFTAFRKVKSTVL